MASNVEDGQTKGNYTERVSAALPTAFFQWGWLLVVVFPLTQLGGRALFNVIASVYALWGLFSLWSRRRQMDRATTSLYLLLLGVFVAGIPGAFDSERALRILGSFVSQSVALLCVPIALRESPHALNRLLNSMAISGGIVLIGLYLLLPYYWLGWSGQPFNPLLQLRKDELPFLLPFLLWWIWQHNGDAGRYWKMAGVVAIVLTYVVIAEGRAALFGLLVALTVFCRFALHWRVRWIVGLAALVFLAALAANTGPFRKVELDPENPLDAFTTGRTILWRHALAHPPARPWLGVGIGNGVYAQEILTFQLSGVPIYVRHLHNFLLDAWYETGLLGVGMLASIIGLGFWRLVRAWGRFSPQDRQQAGVLLAAALAIIGSALLSFSYTSQHFSYLFVCLGAFNHMAATLGKTNGGLEKEAVGKPP